MHRFFVPPEWLQGRTIEISGPVARQLSRVLRLRPGTHVVLLDGSGWSYEVALVQVGADHAMARLVEKTRPQTEPRVQVTLYQALPKGRKFDWILQKGTELGVGRFVPMITERTTARRADDDRGHKRRRWQRIVTEAAEQCGRTRIPEIQPTAPFSECCDAPLEHVLAVLASADAGTMTCNGVFGQRDANTVKELRLYVGPEGGFTRGEVLRAESVGILPLSLGPRTLRTETAALVALSVLLHLLGELG